MYLHFQICETNFLAKTSRFTVASLDSGKQNSPPPVLRLIMFINEITNCIFQPGELVLKQIRGYCNTSDRFSILFYIEADYTLPHFSLKKSAVSGIQVLLLLF